MNGNKFLVRVAFVFALALLLAPVAAMAQHHIPGQNDPWNNCVDCHGETLEGDFARSCMSCHNYFVEPDLPATGHHMPGRDDPYNNCTDCHGETLNSCFTCHLQVWPDPPPANDPPTADPNGPYAAMVGDVVTFDGSGSTDDVGIATYDWEFGDGATGTGISPTHTYAVSGTYTVVLTVTDDDGATDTADTTATIDDDVLPPINQTPLADPGGPYDVLLGDSAQCDGSASIDIDGTIATYDWDFGDGNFGTGVSPSHTYAAVGIYDVTLTVTDNDGATDTAATTVTVTEEPPQPGGLDLNITKFQVTKKVKLKKRGTPRRVKIKLRVANPGTEDGEALASVVGVQGGVEVYNEIITVSSDPQSEANYEFPSYVPVNSGDIVWTVMIADADLDEVEATTRVVE